MNYMFSYKAYGGLCGNICSDDLTELAIRANSMLNYVDTFSFLCYTPNSSGVSVLSNLQ